MDAANALLEVHGVPGQVIVEQDAGELKIDAFPPRRGADEHLGTILATESFLCRGLRTVIPALEDIDTSSGKDLVQLFPDGLHRAEIGREDDDFFVRILLPDLAQGVYEHRGF